ncbi:hypothetical protein V2J09_012007 [Rumex salicifolius]
MVLSGLRQKAKDLAFMSLPFTLAKPTLSSAILRPATCYSPRSAADMSSAASANSPSAAVDATDIATAGIHGDLEFVFKQKKSIRSKVRKALKEMDPALRSLEDSKIQQIVLEAPWFKSSKRLCAYISCSALREVDTSNILKEILHNPKDSEELNAKTLYVPRVEDKNSYMRMFNISSTEDLVANSMNILEPSPVDSNGNQREDVMLASEPVDLLLLPGLAFDKSGRRLGRGGGYVQASLATYVFYFFYLHLVSFRLHHLLSYHFPKSNYYDTFLSNYKKLANERSWKQPLLVGLSYSLQILDEDVIPVTPNDVFIDALVSPAGITPISQTAVLRMKHEI